MRLDQVFILTELLYECSRAISARLEVMYKLLKSVKFQHKLIVVGSVLYTMMWKKDKNIFME